MATTATPKSIKPAERVVDVRLVPLDAIEVIDGFNPRNMLEEIALNELAESISERGLLDALGVSPIGDPSKGRYQLISGHRRHAGCVRVKLAMVPVTIRDADDTERLIDAIASNQHREDLTPLDEALAFDRLKTLGMTQKGIAQQLKVSEKLVSDRLVLAGLPEALRDRFRQDWPTSLVRTMAGMVEIREEFGLAVAAAIERSSDASLPRALANLRESPLHSVVQLAGAGYLPGAYPVSAAGDKSGGGYKGGPREHSGVWDGFDALAAVGLPGLTAESKAKLKALIEHLPHPAQHKDYRRYVIYLDQAVLDALAAARVLYTHGNAVEGVCVDGQSLAVLLEPIIDADHAGMLKAKAKEVRTAAKGPEAQAKADERAKAAQAVAAAREFNLQLGEALAVNFGKVPLTIDTAKMLCRMALAGASHDVGGIRGLAERGLRYVLPSWQQEIVTVSTGNIRHRYAGEGTKNPDKPHAADKNPEDLFWEWWNLAQTPEEVLGRTIQALAAARYANQDAVPQSRRRYGDLTGVGQYASGPQKAAQGTLTTMVKPKLPGATKKRAPKPKSGAAAPRPALSVKHTKALELITASPGITIAELAKAMGLQHSTLARVLPGLVKAGKARQEGRAWHPVEASA